MVKRYRERQGKNPHIIEAIQYLREKNIADVQDFVSDGSLIYDANDNEYYIVRQDNDRVRCDISDYIVKTPNGNFAVCPEDTFKRLFKQNYSKRGKG